MPFLQFPKQERATLSPLMTLRPTVNTRNVKVYCVCRMPDHFDRKMVECEECEQWFFVHGVQYKSSNTCSLIPRRPCPAFVAFRIASDKSWAWRPGNEAKHMCTHRVIYYTTNTATCGQN